MPCIETKTVLLRLPEDSYDKDPVELAVNNLLASPIFFAVTPNVLLSPLLLLTRSNVSKSPTLLNPTSDPASNSKSQ